MKKIILSFFLLACAMASTLVAQTRYLDPVFSDVTVQTNVVYGVNATVLAYPTIIKQPLIMDVYRPVGDVATNRPVVLYLHTGNFLPFQSPIDGSYGFNGACGGTLRDSSVIEACTRLAKMGYVACAVDYRLGWNPLASNDVLRRYGIINAAYRGIQDVRTCIRYLRKNVAEGNNTFGVDPDKIVVWGQGTGGYISLNATCLDDYLKIPLASDGKFFWDHDNNPATPPIPMVIPQVNGDIYGTSVGLNPATGDTLCYANHVGYDSDFALAINMAGACADSAWVDPGQTPIISFHVPHDNFAPYGEGIVNVPGTNLQVVKVQGSFTIQHMLEDNGNNNPYDQEDYYGVTGNQAAAFANTPASPNTLDLTDYTDNTPGLFPFLKPLVPAGGTLIPTTTAPWEWTGGWTPTPPQVCNMDKGVAVPYIDTIFNFVAPRACFALGLQGCIDHILSAKETQAPASISVVAAPNPSVSDITFTVSDNKMIQSIQLFDFNGKQIMRRDVNSDNYTLLRKNLVRGTYIAKLNLEEGFVTKVIRFE